MAFALKAGPTHNAAARFAESRCVSPFRPCVALDQVVATHYEQQCGESERCDLAVSIGTAAHRTAAGIRSYQDYGAPNESDCTQYTITHELPAFAC
jgi:hypothetical protein